MSNNYRYVITIDRNDEPLADRYVSLSRPKWPGFPPPLPAEPGTRVLKQGHRRRADADLAYSYLIQNARKEFRMPNDPLPWIDTPADRRAGILHAVAVGPVTITLRRRTPSDSDAAITLPPTASKTVEHIITWGAAAIFWGAIFIYVGVEHGYQSVIDGLIGIVGFFAVIVVGAVVIAIAVRAVSALRDRLLKTQRGRGVEFVLRRGLFYTYVVLITPVIVLICIFGAIAMLGQFIEIWSAPLGLVVAIGRWIGIW